MRIEMKINFITFIVLLCVVADSFPMETEKPSQEPVPLNPFFPTLKLLCEKQISNELLNMNDLSTARTTLQNYATTMNSDLLAGLANSLSNPIEHLKKRGKLIKISPHQNYLMYERENTEAQYCQYKLYRLNENNLNTIYSRTHHLISNLISDEISFSQDEKTIALFNQIKTAIELFQLPECQLLSTIDRESFGRPIVIEFSNPVTLIGFQKFFGETLNVYNVDTNTQKKIDWPYPISHIIPTENNNILVPSKIGDQQVTITCIHVPDSSEQKLAIVNILKGLSFVSDITCNKNQIACASNKNVYLHTLNHQENPTINSIITIAQPAFKLKSPIQCLRFSPENTHLAVAHCMTHKQGPYISIIDLEGNELLKINLAMCSISWDKKIIMQPMNPLNHAPIMSKLPDLFLDRKNQMMYNRAFARFAQQLVKEKIEKESVNNNNALITKSV